jgi:hypothetical protein
MRCREEGFCRVEPDEEGEKVERRSLLQGREESRGAPQLLPILDRLMACSPNVSASATKAGVGSVDVENVALVQMQTASEVSDGGGR